MVDEVLTDENQDGLATSENSGEAPRKPHVPHVIPDARVKKMLERARLEGLEEGKRHMQEQFQSQLSQMPAQAQALPQMPQQLPMQAQVGGADLNLLRQIAAEEFAAQNQRFQQQQQLAREEHDKQQRAAIDSEFKRRLDTSMASNPEHKEALQGLDMAPFEHVKYLATLGVDNTADVIADLAKRPTYLAGLQALAERSPELAQKELEKISKSLKDVHAAKFAADQMQGSEPSGRLTPTSTGVDTGKMSIRDYKAKYKF